MKMILTQRKKKVPYREKKVNRSRAGNVTVFILLLIIAVFTGFPLYYNVVQAFKPPEEIFIFPPRFYVVNPTMKNISDLFVLATTLDVPFIRYLFNSIFVSVVSTFLSVVVGALAAYPFAKMQFCGREFFWRLIMMTLLFSGGATSLATYIIEAKLHLVNTYWVMILPSISSTLYMFLMRQFMLQIPNSLLEAAHIDGAGELRIFWKIVMPNVKPAWMTVAVLTFNGLWNSGSGAAVFNEDLKLLPTALNQITASSGTARKGVAAAATLLLMIPPIITFIFSQKKMLQTMAHSGIKD